VMGAFSPQPNGGKGDLSGLDSSGHFALPNARSGVRLASGASTIGGATSEAGNVISGNGNDGVLINVANTKNNQVQGNFIGTDATGIFGVPNKAHGVEIAGGSSANTIGGEAVGTGNLISGNTANGVLISGTGVTGNQVLGNLIGTDVTGTNALGNDTGIVVSAGAKTNTIGGSNFGAGNVLSGNRSDGLLLTGTGTSG